MTDELAGALHVVIFSPADVARITAGTKTPEEFGEAVCAEVRRHGWDGNPDGVGVTHHSDGGLSVSFPERLRPGENPWRSFTIPAQTLRIKQRKLGSAGAAEWLWSQCRKHGAPERRGQVQIVITEDGRVVVRFRKKFVPGEG